jgi:N-acetylmuramoyl-L-alanine amidase
MGFDHRVFRRGRLRVPAGLAAAGLVLAPQPATVTSADIRSAPAPAARPPLAGTIVGIDPGHNGLNYTSPAFLSRKVWNGREWEACDTTGTRTAGGYTKPGSTGTSRSTCART